MVEESRKPYLRQVWKDFKPHEWHRLISSKDITREEWQFLCFMWEKTHPIKKHAITNPDAFTATPNVADDDIKRLTEAFG